jgi:sigma-E factor negative regulatory protein RseA
LERIGTIRRLAKDAAAGPDRVCGLPASEACWQVGRIEERVDSDERGDDHRGDSMTDALNEQLSACLDGELPPAELDLLLKRVGREAGLRAAIGRYSLIGEAMRAERPVIASPGFADKVMAAVAAEAATADPMPARSALLPRSNRTRNHSAPAAATAAWISPATLRYLRPAAGMAIAAGVAAVAVLTLQPIGQPGQEGASMQIAATSQPAANESLIAPPASSGPSYVVPTSTSTTAFIPATRLTNYVVAHSEYSSPLGRRSVLSGVLADDVDAEVQALEAGQATIQISSDDDAADAATER